MLNNVFGGAREVEKPQLASVWARIRGLLQAEVGDAEYRNWLRPMTLTGLYGDELAISLPTGFVRDWVRDHHGARVNALWQSEYPSVRRVDFVVDDAARPLVDTISEPVADNAKPRVDIEDRSDTRNEIAAALDPRFTFDAFVVGKPNEVAYACARRVAEQPACHGFNPLFLYGGVGLGKTHLMHAIAWELKERS